MTDYNAIKKEYPFTAELHAHTKPVSHCSEIEPDKLIELYLGRGCDTVVITNHFKTSNAKPVSKWLDGYYDTVKAAEGSGINVVLGVEISFQGDPNDYLVYGITEEDIHRFAEYTESNLKEFYKSQKNEKNIILQAHPFRNNMVLAPLDCIDGIEVFNMHPGHNSRVAYACKYASENKLIVSGGTDFHHLGHQGMCLIRTRERLCNSFDVASVLKSGDYLFDINGALVIPEKY